MNTLKYNPELQEKNPKQTNQKIELFQCREETNLYNLQWRRNLYCLISKALQGRVTHDRKCVQSLKPKETEQNYIVNKTDPPSSVSSSEAMGDSSQLPLTKGHSFEASRLVSYLSIKSRLRTKFSYI